MIITSKKQMDLLEFSEFITNYKLKEIIVDDSYIYNSDPDIKEKINIISLKYIDTSKKIAVKNKRFSFSPILEIGIFSFEYLDDKICINNSKTGEKVIIGKNQNETKSTFFNINKGGIKIDFKKNNLSIEQYKFNFFLK